MNGKGKQGKVEEDDSSLHPLFASLKDLTAGTDATFLAIAQVDDDCTTTTTSSRNAPKIIEPSIPFTRRSTRHAVMRPTDRDEIRKRLRDQTSPFISKRLGRKEPHQTQLNDEKQESDKSDDTVASSELSALVKMWKGTNG